MSDIPPAMPRFIKALRVAHLRAERAEAEIERLRALLRQALAHVENEGDDTLATIIDTALSGKGE